MPIPILNRNMLRYLLLLSVGIGLVFYGAAALAIAYYAPEPLSDAEIMERAEALGMVHIRDAWIEEKEQENTD